LTPEAADVRFDIDQGLAVQLVGLRIAASMTPPVTLKIVPPRTGPAARRFSDADEVMPAD
jgi:hypothetical protein